MPDIESAADLTPYCNAFTASFELFGKYHRTEALLHTLRAVETRHAIGDIFSIQAIPEDHYDSLRKSQDLLRLLMYEIFTRAPTGGHPRPTTSDELLLADQTAIKFSEISRVRDFIRMVEIGWTEVDVDRERKIASFFSDELVRFQAHRQKEILDVREDSLSAIDHSSDTNAVRRLVTDICSIVDIRRESNDIAYQPEPELIHAMTQTIQAQTPHLLTSAPLPGEWSIGAYTIAQYRTFYTQLQVLATIRSLVFKRIVLKEGGFVPHNGAAILMKEAEILEHMEEYAALPPSVTLELIRDLHYPSVAKRSGDLRFQAAFWS